MRNVSFDYAKGIGIIIVVFAHLWRGLQGAGVLDVGDAIFVAVSSSATILSMPVFFFVSGVLYGRSIDRRHGVRELAGKFDGIFYPYIIWSLIVGLSEVLGSGYRNGSTDIYSLLGTLWVPRGIFWFLYSLFEAFLLTELLIWVFGVGLARRVIVPVGLLLLVFWQPTWLVLSIAEFQMSFIYFAVGVLLGPKMRMEQINSGWWGYVLIPLIFCVLFSFHLVAGGRTWSSRSVTPNATVVAIVVASLFLLFCYCLPRKGLGWLSMLGERSMDVYLLHLLIIAPIRIVMQKILHIDNYVLFVVVGLPAGVVGSLMLATLIRRFGFGFLFSPPDLISLKKKMS